MNKLNEIQSSLLSISNCKFAEAADTFLGILGYESQRRIPDQTGYVDQFVRNWEAQKPNTRSEKFLCAESCAITLLFQLTDDEIHLNQSEESHFDESKIKSFLFFSVELKNNRYSTSKYAQFTREINKRTAMPAVVIFKTKANLVTIAFPDRRENQIDSERDVLGKVSVVREINPEAPHRAHLDILSNLSLDSCTKWISNEGYPLNFDGLFCAWLKILDIQELNKQFYKELVIWFNQTVEDLMTLNRSFKEDEIEEHIIRILTRLLFIWFLKEKNLVSEDLFNEEKVSKLLKNYNFDGGNTYYKVILQNLFFATLNSEMNKDRSLSLHRHVDLMEDPERLLQLFSKTPFINGGLFDPLENEKYTEFGSHRAERLSYQHHLENLSVPNRLFFGESGLFFTLKRFKFTVEEKTPVDQEIALDPELLGEVFENLLATYNPETRTTVRKETGSYYTPRFIVDYMVGESLMRLVQEKMSASDGDTVFLRDRLSYLFDYADAFDDANELFEKEEKRQIVTVIADLKVLDPAVGSGAFVMGILNRLTLVLERIDPSNEIWKALQIERAKKKFDEALNSDITDTRQATDEIIHTFEQYSTDFGRKLFLIQNSIFGVDIQPIACQIAKLRFFISLMIKQNVNWDSENYGIKPLPNLEAHFVAADSLLSIEVDPIFNIFRNENVAQIEKKLAENREKYFHATSTKRKKDCKDENLRLRQELAAVLDDLGKSESKILNWNPYDQNKKADWFEQRYMFGTQDGFDLVIGNPPYIQLQSNRGWLGKRYQNQRFTSFSQSGDIYCLFYERGLDLLKPNGHLCYITSNKWMRAKYGKQLRNLLSTYSHQMLLDFSGIKLFQAATVDTSILFVKKTISSHSNFAQAVLVKKSLRNESEINNYVKDSKVELDSLNDGPWFIASEREIELKKKIEFTGTPLSDKSWGVSIYCGIKTGCNEAFIVDNNTKDALISADPNSSKLLRPILRGRDITKYKLEQPNLWLIDTHNGYSSIPRIEVKEFPAVKHHLDQFFWRLEKRQDKGKTPYNLRNCAYHELFDDEKIAWSEIAREPTFSLCSAGIYLTNTAYMIHGDNLDYIVGVLNSSITRFYFPFISTNLGQEANRYLKMFVSQIPIPEITESENTAVNEIKSLVRQINDINYSSYTNADTKVNGLLDALDDEVCALFQLTTGERNEIRVMQSGQFYANDSINSTSLRIRP